MFQTNQYGLTPSHTTPHVTAFTPLNTDSAMPVSIFLFLLILLKYSFLPTLEPDIHFPFNKKKSFRMSYDLTIFYLEIVL